MFKKKGLSEGVNEDIDSLIGENIKIIGNIEGKGNLRIDGIVEGDINYNGNVFIGETGSVSGSIKSDDISLAGTVNGNIVLQTKLVILPKGILIGNVEVPSFVVHEDAKFDGNCKMTGSEIPNVTSKQDKASKSESI